MTETTKPDKTRQLSIEQENAIEHLLQGKSDAAVADAVGVSRQTIWEWRNKNPVFIAELNRQRVELWSEARERMKALVNRSLDVIEHNLDSDDPKASLIAAQYVLKSTKLLSGQISMPIGPTTPEAVIQDWVKSEAYAELAAEMSPDDLLGSMYLDSQAENLARTRVKSALKEYGL